MLRPSSVRRQNHFPIAHDQRESSGRVASPCCVAAKRRASLAQVSAGVAVTLLFVSAMVLPTAGCGSVRGTGKPLLQDEPAAGKSASKPQTAQGAPDSASKSR